MVHAVVKLTQPRRWLQSLRTKIMPPSSECNMAVTPDHQRNYTMPKLRSDLTSTTIQTWNITDLFILNNIVQAGTGGRAV